MKTEVEALGRVRLRGLLLLAAVFLAGGFAGALGERMQNGHREPRPPWSHASRDLPPPLARMDLTDAQRHEIHAILDRVRPMSDSLMQATMPRVRELMDEAHRQIREVLTPEQREVFDHEMRRGPGRRHGRPRPRDGGRDGSPPWGPPPDVPPAGGDSSDGEP